MSVPIVLSLGVASSAHEIAGETSSDFALVMQASGWSADEVRIHLATAETLGEVAAAISEQSNQFVGSALADDPRGMPAIYLKGPASHGVRALVEAAGIAIDLVDNQPFSLDELQLAQQQAHRLLMAAGVPHVASTIDMHRAVLELTVPRQEGVIATPSDVQALISDRLRLTVEVEVVEPAAARLDNAALGGYWMTLSGVDTCTSGWSVREIDTNRGGVTTADHCAPINGIRHGTGSAALHIWSYKGGHLGVWGDVMWGTTAWPEPAQFLADETGDIRPVNSIEPANMLATNDWVCGFGRKSFYRQCFQIRSVVGACDDSYRLTQMTGNHMVPGDSGGGWSYNNRAFGSHVGNCNTPYDFFMPVDYFPQAIGVEVKTQ